MGGDGMITYTVGDTREVIKTIADGSVDLIASSPPFLALRSYLPAGHEAKGDEIGSERNPAEFIDMLLGLTAEWGRVLAPHGSIAIELGDTYAGGGNGPDAMKPNGSGSHNLYGIKVKSSGQHWPRAKSLALIPQLYAVALAYGINPLTGQPSPAGRWLVRNVIVWARPNPAVGELGDKVRPSTSYIVIATRSPKRWFDLTAVRTPGTEPGAVKRHSVAQHAPNQGWSENNSEIHQNPAGAPPLDCWLDEYDGSHNTWTLTTQPSRISVKVITKVPCGPDDGGERTTSPDCPVHGDRAAPAPTEHDGELPDARSPLRTSRTGDDHEPKPPAPGVDGTSSCSRSGSLATPRSTSASRTDLAQSTSQPDTPSARTVADTPHTPASPESCGDHPDTSASSNAEACLPADEPETAPRNEDTSDPSSACSCTFHIDTPSLHSHYAMWPAKLAERLVLMMCPREVCRVCGEPRRRVERPGVEYLAEKATRTRANDGFRPQLNGKTITADPQTLGWTDCGHDDYRPGMVVDVFAGSGTTLAVADLHGRDAIGIDFDARNHDIYPARYDEVKRALFGSPIPDANQMELAL